jgi:hypothetical protein
MNERSQWRLVRFIWREFSEDRCTLLEIALVVHFRRKLLANAAIAAPSVAMPIVVPD